MRITSGLKIKLIQFRNAILQNFKPEVFDNFLWQGVWQPLIYLKTWKILKG